MPVAIGTGALVFAGGVLVLSLAGSPDATAAVFTCAAPSGAPVPTDPADLSAAFPAATYGDCMLASAGGGLNSAGYAQAASVTVSVHDGQVTAVTSGSSPSTSFDFTPTSNGTASLVPGQIAEGSCFEFADAGLGVGDASDRFPPDPTPVAVPLAGVSGALVLEGRSLFLDITGTDRCSTAAVLAMVCTAKQ